MWCSGKNWRIISAAAASWSCWSSSSFRGCGLPTPQDNRSGKIPIPCRRSTRFCFCWLRAANRSFRWRLFSVSSGRWSALPSASIPSAANTPAALLAGCFRSRSIAIASSTENSSRAWPPSPFYGDRSCFWWSASARRSLVFRPMPKNFGACWFLPRWGFSTSASGSLWPCFFRCCFRRPWPRRSRPSRFGFSCRYSYPS